jgi:hypothetical protein
LPERDHSVGERSYARSCTRRDPGIAQQVLLMSAPLRSRRVTTSRSIHLLEKTATDTTWVMDGRSIFHLFSIFGSVAQDVQVDCDGFLSLLYFL